MGAGMALETCLEGVAAVKSAWGFSVYPLSLLLDEISSGCPERVRRLCAAKRTFDGNIDGRPVIFMRSGEPFMQQRNPTAKERSSTALRFASSPRSILRRSGGASRVEMNALRAPLTPLPTSPGDPAELRGHRFPQVLEIMPPSKNRSASSVLRNFLARREERPFVVPFERFHISLRKERPR